MKITIHEEKNSHFTFHRKKRADHESRKYPTHVYTLESLTFGYTIIVASLVI